MVIFQSCENVDQRVNLHFPMVFPWFSEFLVEIAPEAKLSNAARSPFQTLRAKAQKVRRAVLVMPAPREDT